MLTPKLVAAALALPLAVVAPPLTDDSDVYQQDVEFALDALEEQCGHFFDLKGIDWKGVRREFTKAAKEVESVEEHWVLLVRLLARLEDGHARVNPLPAAGSPQWPLADEAPQGGPGIFLCRSGKKVLIKNAWGGAAEVGITAGMEVLEIEDERADRWLEAKVAELRDLTSFSTDHQAFYTACHWGLAGERGSTLSLELRTVDRKKKKRTLTRGRESVVPYGPVFPPEGLETIGRQSYGRTPAGYGYIHLRDVPGELPDQLDTMLAAIGPVPGLIVDCRANGGGGVDHDAVFGRFVPRGKELQRRSAYPIPSAGPNPYGGPVVVIVDAGVRSSGETISGMLKEDGRAYMIGETPTAGMSSSKTTIELPSKLFALYVSVRSNKARFQNGRGIEGIGIEPHELVEYDAQDLDQGVDTALRRAEELLADFPQKEVDYDPAKHGWEPPAGS